MLLHVLRHVNTHHGPLIVEQEFGQGSCQFRFPNTGWSQEKEAGQGTIGVLQSSTRTTNRVRDGSQRVLLSYHAFTQAILHRDQLLHFALHQPGDGDMRPFRDDFRNIFSIDLFLEHTGTLDVCELGLQLMDTFLQLRNGSIAQPRHFFVVILAFSPLQFHLCLLQFLVQAANILDGFAFAFQR